MGRVHLLPPPISHVGKRSISTTGWETGRGWLTPSVCPSLMSLALSTAPGLLPLWLLSIVSKLMIIISFVVIVLKGSSTILFTLWIWITIWLTIIGMSPSMSLSLVQVKVVLIFKPYIAFWAVNSDISYMFPIDVIIQLLLVRKIVSTCVTFGGCLTLFVMFLFYVRSQFFFTAAYPITYLAKKLLTPVIAG